ncbi:ESX-1 secretion-associated protein EspI isoform X1 [Alligator mississippiensis]|uniref:ESX-1 secretion-associated protein EspI isoform X1 n=1 Tax=Alligator mississippiensis TaxID=8496 RepID=UPI0028776CFB|nr:ESX-1 secretion-associated protein EspI isoform X1 [Alligator mississippiensis]
MRGADENRDPEGAARAPRGDKVAVAAGLHDVSNRLSPAPRDPSAFVEDPDTARPRPPPRPAPDAWVPPRRAPPPRPQLGAIFQNRWGLSFISDPGPPAAPRDGMSRPDWEAARSYHRDAWDHIWKEHTQGLERAAGRRGRAALLPRVRPGAAPNGRDGCVRVRVRAGVTAFRPPRRAPPQRHALRGHRLRAPPRAGREPPRCVLGPTEAAAGVTQGTGGCLRPRYHPDPALTPTLSPEERALCSQRLVLSGLALLGLCALGLALAAAGIWPTPARDKWAQV